ncbi:MAG: ribonuclease P protein component [Atopobiaceae bacterium]|jgi:ribonuclease P protein component|nr:ribonuclease P protein component [Atopobiaceae bacterium]MCH4180832.1 ribonuclease P protein component [Atopobiaceae bacterium]MCH4214125.1 ribonuclease P protein component [Atopobiaceae bacterium]MCH4229701.1 ribonuclease P protein component [Atopobiaceae bacterium]MCH4276477.1 ribonuclease P protein component [Atopobiaceae bacterium]
MRTIKSKLEFERVFSQGRRENGHLVRLVYKACDEGDQGKVAFVAAKRFGNAVYRNRCKRVMREAFHEVAPSLDEMDVILFSTRSTNGAHPHEVAQELDKLLCRARRHME